MNVYSCKKCKRLVSYIKQGICMDCWNKAEEKFNEIKEYIYENPGTSILNIAKEFEIERFIIEHWIKEERLEISKDSAIKIYCRSCNTPITCGEFCNKCKYNMAKDFSSVYKKDIPSKPSITRDSDKMRFLHKNSDF